MGEKELEEIINKAVSSAIERELGSYKVDKEQHYQDHIFLRDLRKWFDDIRSSFWKSFVAAIVPALLMLIVLGFIAWAGLKSAVGLGR